jgi:hypothetical protein
VRGALLIGFTLAYAMATAVGGYYLVRFLDPGCFYGFGCNLPLLSIGAFLALAIYVLGMLMIAQLRP